MLAVLRYTLIRLRWQIIGWGLGIASLGLLIVSFHGTFMDQQEDFLQMLESYPAEFLAFFGGDAASMATSEGYLGMYGFSMLPVIIGIFAVLAGSGLIASDEESGRLDLILAHPVSRSAFFWGRVLALIVATLAVAVLGWLGFSVLLGRSSLGVTWGEMALPFVTVVAQSLIYSALALLLSLFLPARRLAAMVAGLVLVTSYFLSSMTSLSEGLEPIARLLPYAYFQGSDALNGLNLTWLLGLVAVSLLLSLLAWWRFQRRDIRIGGEGAWQRPELFRKFRHRETATQDVV